MPVDPWRECLPGEELAPSPRKEARQPWELGVGSGPQGPSQVSGPQMKSESLVPPGGDQSVTP